MTKRRGSKVRDAIIDAPSGQPAAVIVALDHILSGYEMRPDGLYKLASGDRKSDTWLCAPFTIEAETRDEGGGNWGFLVSWHDRDGRRHEETFPRVLFSTENCGELCGCLAYGGLSMENDKFARQALARYFGTRHTKNRARSVQHVGWHVMEERRIFVLPPDRVFGAAAERVVLQGAEREIGVFNSSATLDDWRENVSRLCIGNSRLLFAASCAFAAPLLGLLGEDGGGFNIKGKSKLGKSTALRIAASVCGGAPGQGADGFVRQWRATGNGLEAVAAAHCDCLLCLDELGQVDGREAGDVIYMLANGQGKARASRSGAGRPAARFRALFLSTGELGLADKLAEAGRTMRAGQEVRLVDVSADAGAGLGLFEQLHDEASADEFAQLLRRATASHYGTALPAFLERLVAELQHDPAGFVDFLRERIKALVAEWLADAAEAGGQVRSVAIRFALVGLAGELVSLGGRLATGQPITEWPAGDAAAAAGLCFRAWLGDRGTLGAAEDAQAVRQLRDFIVAKGSSDFEPWQEPKQLADGQQVEDDVPPAERFRPQERAGWRRWQRGEDGRGCWCYYVSSRGMRRALTGLNFDEALEALVGRGLLVMPSGAYARKRNDKAHSLPVPGHGKQRLYIVHPAITASEDGTG